MPAYFREVGYQPPTDPEKGPFQYAFNTNKSAFDYWQDLQLRVALKKKTGKSVKIVAVGKDDEENESKEAQDRFKVLLTGSLCKMITSRIGSRIC